MGSLSVCTHTMASPAYGRLENRAIFTAVTSGPFPECTATQWPLILLHMAAMSVWPHPTLLFSPPFHKPWSAPQPGTSCTQACVNARLGSLHNFFHHLRHKLSAGVDLTAECEIMLFTVLGCPKNSKHTDS